ncbi:uncharacterized protein LOC128993411 [Macrosteles quadrilineatus]|uniref:uncharacterized protein LOC128993411 n=1 Tax=Macrosteles quadrilineatus TaxID=74068 RepID=UPI0023E18257|nr:uncharacterized protein LOC128993411 [Macrosteles quadrilineatus]
MVSNGFVALFVAVAIQAAAAHYYDGCGCDPVPSCEPAYTVGCCPGPVVEKNTVVNKAVNVPYTYQVPTYSKKCYQQPAGVDKKVIPSTYETCPVCETSQTIVKVPTTDIEVQQTPLCKKTCTTSEYIIQIPIVETTCTSTPLCKKTVKTQDNLLTTCARKTSCAKQVCTQNKVIETPLTSTVCQDYQGSICKTGCKTVIQPEIKKSCVQLPPYKCLKPTGYSAPAYGAYAAAPAYSGMYADAAYPTDSYYPGASYAADSYYPGASYYSGAYDGAYADAVYPAGAPCGCGC